MGRVILIDDDDLIADIITDAFIKAGHGIGWLADGKQALSVIEARPPHLVILDQQMPGIRGSDVLRAMRTNRIMAPIPVMMLTVVSGEANERISMYEGADFYMTKPFKTDELVYHAERLMKLNLRRHIPS